MPLCRVPGLSAWNMESSQDEPSSSSSDDYPEPLSLSVVTSDVAPTDSESENMGSAISLNTTIGAGIGKSLFQSTESTAPASFSCPTNAGTPSLSESVDSTSSTYDPCNPQWFKGEQKISRELSASVNGRTPGVDTAISNRGKLATVMLALFGVACHQWVSIPSGANRGSSIDKALTVPPQSSTSSQGIFLNSLRRSTAAELTAEAEAARLATLDGETLDWLKSLHFLDAAPEDVYLAAEDHFNKTLREPIQIAITGQSGVGKSTLVNTLRGLPPTALSAAPVSPLQMTGVKAPYKEDGYASPHSPGVVYHDLPGCGTAAVPACGPLYYQAFAMSRFDAFILVTSGRVEDSDLQIYREIVSQGQISMANHGVIVAINRSGHGRGCWCLLRLIITWPRPDTACVRKWRVRASLHCRLTLGTHSQFKTG